MASIFSKFKKKKPIDLYKLAEKTRKDYEAEQAYRENKAGIAYYEQQKAYGKTRTGKISRNVTKLFNRASSPGSFTANSYGSQMPPSIVMREKLKTIKGVYAGRKGRPKGTLDRRYAAYGGVYGWRKVMAQKRALERLKARRMYEVSPDQEAVIQRYRQQQNQQYQNPENKIFPDTAGGVPMQDVFKDIDDAANLVP